MNKLRIFFFSTCILMISCSRPIKDLTYFKDGSNTTLPVYTEPVFAKGDILSIVISSDNPKASELFNLPNIQPSNIQAPTQAVTSGYLINEQGEIQISQLGDIHAEGKTKLELTNELKNKLSEYLQNPIVNIRLINFKITILGEVNKPGTYNIPNEKVNILEAIGLAGDLTLFGERKTVVVIRNDGKNNHFERLDLTNKEIFNSTYFNLKQNDIVYIDVNPRKINNTDQTTVRTIGIVTGIISSVAFLITILRQ